MHVAPMKYRPARTVVHAKPDSPKPMMHTDLEWCGYCGELRCACHTLKVV